MQYNVRGRKKKLGEDDINMKKAFVLFLSMVLSVLFLAPTVLAEGNDLASTSLDDLLVLRQNIESEITARLASDASTIYPGVYYVGKDIKEGSFVITTTQDYTTIDVFSNEENFAAYTSMLSEGFADAGGSVYIRLEIGMVLSISGGNCHIQLADANWGP